MIFLTAPNKILLSYKNRITVIYNIIEIKYLVKFFIKAQRFYCKNFYLTK